MALSTARASEAAELRGRLGHPVVDADGHIVEAFPLLVETMAKVAGADVAARFGSAAASFASRQQGLLAAHDPALRHGAWIAPWWTVTAGARDRVTAFVPALMHERMDELGLDFSVLYTSAGLVCIGHPDEAIRRGGCRAINTYLAERCDGLGDRLAPAAVIPNHTPEEALAELAHAVDVLGFKAVVMNGVVLRFPEGAPTWTDHLAIDSPYDYEPVFADCEARGLAVTSHSPTMGLPLRQSSSRYSANHIGTFAASGDAFAKALVYGGVPARHPGLQFAFLEGGVGWGVQLLADLVGHFDKRGPHAIGHLDPARIDRDEWNALLDRYGGPCFADPELRRAMLGQSDNPPADVDDFRDSGVRDAEGFAALFDRFFFGCEADDPLIPWAFAVDRLPGRRPLRPVLGSDVGHWDVPDMAGVLPEAWELVQDGAVGPDQFRAFVCDNPILLFGRGNPAFFDSTPAQAYARQLLAADTGTGPAD